ncbi:MAG: TIGR03986 family CRISPR-associated RAMP protein [Oscillospiraceae bacterium]
MPYNQYGSDQKRGGFQGNRSGSNTAPKPPEYMGAPYNFVPFPDQIITRYPDASQLPRHDLDDPALKSGTIAITLTAQTPVFVSDGNKANPDFFRGVDGSYQIPGSTLRGLIRENMQILGFGKVTAGEDIEDSRIFFRQLAAANELNSHYKKVLNIQVDQMRKISVPRNVQAGYLEKRGRDYVIHPTQAPGFYALRERDPICGPWRGMKPPYADPVWYRLEGTQVKELKTGAVSPGTGWKRGVLQRPGRMAIQCHLYLFPEENPQVSPVVVPHEDGIAYKADWEVRKNTLKPSYFWELPKGNARKPVFYLRHEGHVYFGMSQYLRIGFTHTLCQGLPGVHRGSTADCPVLDYPHAMLGFAGKKVSYRSRVSFGALRASATPGAAVPVILGAPKPSFFTGYVEDGKNYNNADFRLRGYKRYWFKDPERPPMEERSANVATKLRPMPVGTRFSGTLRYRNLSQDELGLLLWCLMLEPDCSQSIGMGKPYGYGKMEFHIDALKEDGATDLYASPAVSADPGTAGLDVRIAAYRKAYEDYADAALHLENRSTFVQEPPVRDFLYMAKTKAKNEEVRYMHLGDGAKNISNEYQRQKKVLPTVAELREKWGG